MINLDGGRLSQFTNISIFKDYFGVTREASLTDGNYEYLPLMQLHFLELMYLEGTHANFLTNFWSLESDNTNPARSWVVVHTN